MYVRMYVVLRCVDDLSFRTYVHVCFAEPLSEPARHLQGFLGDSAHIPERTEDYQGGVCVGV